MGFDKNTVKFLNFCSRHGFDVHDGTKNECCDQGSVMPMLDKNGLAALNEKGIDAFVEDVKRVTPLINAADPVKYQGIIEWRKQLSIDLKMFKNDVDAALAPEESESAEDEEDDSESVPSHQQAVEEYAAKREIDGYVNGFKDGFKEGIEAAKELFNK